jgi:O-antigen ligase
MFKAHPIAGVGLGGYWAGITEYHDASGSLTPQEAHNDYLELLASAGIIGACLGGWFLVILVRRVSTSLRSTNQARRGARFGAAIGIIGVLVHSIFDFGLHMFVNALVFAALIVVATRASEEEQKPHTTHA